MCCRASPVCVVARAGVLGFLDGSTAVLLGELPRMILVFWISICARCSCSDGCLFVVLGVFLVVWFVEGSVI